MFACSRDTLSVCHVDYGFNFGIYISFYSRPIKAPQTQTLTRHIAYIQRVSFALTYIYEYISNSPSKTSSQSAPLPGMCVTFKLAPECVKIIIYRDLDGATAHIHIYLYIYK